MRSRDVFRRSGRSREKPQIVDSTGVFVFWRFRLFLDIARGRGHIRGHRGDRGPIWGSPHATHQDVPKPATIDNAKAKDKRYDLTDGGGLVLELMPSGSKTWRFECHLSG
jgi:hypothetical protein